jgi:hypothetical protein
VQSVDSALIDKAEELFRWLKSVVPEVEGEGVTLLVAASWTDMQGRRRFAYYPRFEDSFGNVMIAAMGILSYVYQLAMSIGQGKEEAWKTSNPPNRVM